ncbi:diadenosine tetraphosphate hydrolase [Candidatus Campbellbacteria bacterium]|nr:MAG: diadenosine tetraphosphate hydrolase [Candidatus Campbellbacteria bacterium]
MKQNTEKSIFEKIVDREIPATILYENDKYMAFLDAFPFEKGHLLVIPKKRYIHVWDMPEDEYLELQKIVLKFAKKIRQEFNCGLNILQNNQKIAGQMVDHLHFHLIPRVEDKDIYTHPKPFEYSEEDKKELQNILKID